jgi:hypothetical protein
VIMVLRARDVIHAAAQVAAAAGDVVALAHGLLRSQDSRSPMQLYRSRIEQGDTGSGASGRGGGRAGFAPLPVHSPRSYLGAGWGCGSWGVAALAAWTAAAHLHDAAARACDGADGNPHAHVMTQRWSQLAAAVACPAALAAMQLLIRSAGHMIRGRITSLSGLGDVVPDSS